MDGTVAIISRHAVSNYGSLLQAYALQRAIEKLGLKPFHIDYDHRSEGPWQGSFAQLRGSRQWNRNALTRAFYLLVRFPERALEAHRFAVWRAAFLSLSARRYRDDQSLVSQCPEASVYCTGSDQVWNITARGVLDWNYFLAFLGPDVRRIAYASSFGRDSLTKDEEGSAKRHLQLYQAISVREQPGVHILEAMGIPSQRVLDPTMLLTSDEWSELMPEKAPRRRYLLVYRLNASRTFDDYARRMAKSRGLELIRISTKAHDFLASGKVLVLPSVGDFLWYFKNADLVLTDSFHGTVFSLIFNTPFVEFLPAKYQGRNLDILQLTGLTGRIVADSQDCSLFDQPIDFLVTNDVLDRERKASLRFLESALSE